MTAMRKIWATRVNNATASTYVGHKGTIFFDELTGALRISDGVTVGGQPLTLVASDFSFQFGDFVATTPANGAATLMSRLTNQNVDIVSNGTGVINMVGDFHVHRTLDYDPDTYDINGAVFAIKSDGQIQMKVPLSDSTSGALEVIGNDSGLFVSPNQTGVIIHITGNSGLPSRNYFDANQNYALIAGRRYNGTQSDPRRVLINDLLFRLVGQASTAPDNASTATFQTFGPARIDFVATENQTATAQGGEIRFYATANGSPAASTSTLVATFNATTGVTANKFVGTLTGTATTATYAQSFNTSTLVTNAVTAVQAGIVTTAAQPNITSLGTLTNLHVTGTITGGVFNGKTTRNVRDAGTIADGGTVTIDFATDDVVLFVWGNGVNLAYSNYTAGRIVRIIARKATGTGVDQFNLDGVTAANVSSGATTFSGSQDTTYFVELTCTNSTLGSVYVKL